MTKRVAVIGSGYVGTVVSACLAHIGHNVIGVESDAAKLELLRDGRAPFHERNLDQLLEAGRQAGRLGFTSDMALAMDESDLVFICVGTPSRPDGKADMSAMLEVAQAAAPHVKHPHTFINKSTVPIGSGRWLSSVIEDAAGDPRVAKLVRVASNPEFLREGTAVSDYLHPDRVVIGADDTACLDDIVELYQPVLDQSFPGSEQRGPVPLVKTDLMTAEMIKYAANAFLATKISFANEMARFCDLMGADIQTVTAGIGLDQRIGPRFLNAGLGWGGSCFTKDVLAMITTAAEYGYQARLLEATMAINNDQRHLVVERLLRHLKNLRGARIALTGPVLQAGHGRPARLPGAGHRHPGPRVRRLCVRLRPGGQGAPGGPARAHRPGRLRRRRGGRRRRGRHRVAAIYRPGLRPPALGHERRAALRRSQLPIADDRRRRRPGVRGSGPPCAGRGRRLTIDLTA